MADAVETVESAVRPVRAQWTKKGTAAPKESAACLSREGKGTGPSIQKKTAPESAVASNPDDVDVDADVRAGAKEAAAAWWRPEAGPRHRWTSAVDSQMMQRFERTIGVVAAASVAWRVAGCPCSVSAARATHRSTKQTRKRRRRTNQQHRQIAAAVANVAASARNAAAVAAVVVVSAASAPEYDVAVVVAVAD